MYKPKEEICENKKNLSGQIVLFLLRMFDNYLRLVGAEVLKNNNKHVKNCSLTKNFIADD